MWANTYTRNLFTVSELGVARQPSHYRHQVSAGAVTNGTVKTVALGSMYTPITKGGTSILRVFAMAAGNTTRFDLVQSEDMTKTLPSGTPFTGIWNYVPTTNLDDYQEIQIKVNTNANNLTLYVDMIVYD